MSFISLIDGLLERIDLIEGLIQTCNVMLNQQHYEFTVVDRKHTHAESYAFYI